MLEMSVSSTPIPHATDPNVATDPREATGPVALGRHATIAERAMGLMLDLGAERCDPAILQPAEPFLDLVGEAIRPRLFLSDAGEGETMCLRPEFTVPAARTYLEGGGGERRYALAGTVFARGAARFELPQAGIEALAHADRPLADATAMADALHMVRQLGVDAVTVVTGDRAIFEAVAASLGIPAPWVRRLARLFGDANALERALSGIAESEDRNAGETAFGADPSLPVEIVEAAEREDLAALERLIAERITATRMGAGARRAREIAARLLEHRDPGALTLGDRERETLRGFLALDVPFPGVGDAVRDLGFGGEAVGAALEAHDGRVAHLRALGADVEAIGFRGSFGRPLDYYTGLVFELRALNGTVLAAGGRYDRLLTMLGAPRPVPAVGFAVWLDAFEGSR